MKTTLPTRTRRQHARGRPRAESGEAGTIRRDEETAHREVYLIGSKFENGSKPGKKRNLNTESTLATTWYLYQYYDNTDYGLGARNRCAYNNESRKIAGPALLLLPVYTRTHGRDQVVQRTAQDFRRLQDRITPRTGHRNPQVSSLRHGKGGDRLILVRGTGPVAIRREERDPIRQQAGHLSERAAPHQHGVRLDHTRHGVLHVRTNVQHDWLLRNAEHSRPVRAAERARLFFRAVGGDFRL